MIIKKASVAESITIAGCLLLGMKQIVYRFIGTEDPEEATAFMLHFVRERENQYSFENCWVALIDEEVVAAANVYDGANLYALRQPVLDYIKANYQRDLQPEDETSAGEYYLDALGVAPTHQGKGIGTHLLEFLIREYVTRQQQRLGLLVDDENPAAKKLYKKLGFKTAGRKTLLGKQMQHLQIRV